MKPTLTVSGDRDVALRFEQFPEGLRQRLHGAIERLTERLAARVRAATPKRSGRLASEVRSRVEDGPEFVRGRVFIDAPDGRDAGKAAALEYGAHKPPRKGFVVEHKRSLNHLWGRAVSPMEVIVDRYTRTANIMERRYLRGPFQAMRGEIEEEMRDAVTETARQTELA